MSQTVIGVFDTPEDAQQAVTQLVNNGFLRGNIDVSSPGTYGGTGTSTSSSTDLDSTFSGGTSSYAGSSLTGDTTTSTEKSGSGIGSFFRSLFGNDDEADRYSGVASKSGSIVTVHAQSASEAQQAADILDDNGAVDVDEKATQYGYGSATSISETSDLGTTGTSLTSGLGTTGTSLTSDASLEGTKSIPIIEEELQVGKRTVQTGGARLRSRIIERPVEESLRLREERVTVDRNTVDRVATEADFASFKEGTIELTEHAEVPVVSKEARVVEEISLGKEVAEREETIRDTVRKTEVDVENIESTNLRNTTTGTNITGNTTSDDNFTTGSSSTGTL